MENAGGPGEVSFSNKRRGNTPLVLGILSVITSFLGVGFLLGVIGLIFGLIDSVKIKRYKQHGKRKIMAGIICCLIGIITTIIFSLTAGNMLFS